MVTITKKATVTKVADASDVEVQGLHLKQKELQRLLGLSIKHVAEATGAVAYGTVVISLDAKHSMRSKAAGMFSEDGWQTSDGKSISAIGINPYMLGELSEEDIFRLCLEGALFFLSSFTENKILWSFPASTNSKLYPDGYVKITTDGGRYRGPRFLQVASKIPWLECVKDTNTPSVGYITKLSEAGIKAASKILKLGIFDGLHKQMEEPSTKSKSQYVGYVCQLDGCKYAVQISQGIIKGVNDGTIDGGIGTHHGMDYVPR